MKKFVFLYVGVVKPTQEIMDGWTKWFGEIKEHVIDSGNPFAPGKEITRVGVKDLPHDLNSLAGYTILKADSIEEAIKIAQSCPLITGMRVYEAVSM